MATERNTVRINLPPNMAATALTIGLKAMDLLPADGAVCEVKATANGTLNLKAMVGIELPEAG